MIPCFTDGDQESSVQSLREKNGDEFETELYMLSQITEQYGAVAGVASGGEDVEGQNTGSVP